MTVSIVGTILLYAAAVALFMFVTREQPRWKRRLAWFAIATALALALIVFLRFTLPVRAFAILAAVALFVGVPVAAVLGLGLLAASRLVKVVRMKVAAERARGYELTPTEEKLPAAVDEERAEMESLGFHVIVSGHAADGSPHILLLHASGSIMGEVVQYLSISTDRPIVEFTSITADRRGSSKRGTSVWCRTCGRHSFARRSPVRAPLSFSLSTNERSLSWREGGSVRSTSRRRKHLRLGAGVST